ncbi:MAG TPA: saccharopine dehydrogenase C-terminal domain-containing protein, partial [Longimicrobiaceae bacterium]|nr:saccharopine dehydrogenase C-terminal domain-containing protein [Longimicrobiaceae bacterium]
MQGVAATMSAFPYYFNGDMARLAVEAGSHFCDLGGNTEIVWEQKKLAEQAAAKGLSVVPDCGLAPGMVNILAQFGIDRLDTVSAVRIKVGGLPQNPTPPLNYQIVYSIEGMLDYYTTLSWVLRDGKPTKVTALSEIEELDIPGAGTLEAFHTAGGLSTMADRYEGKIPTMEYKTLRYPGHAKMMETIRDLGLLGLDPVQVKDSRTREMKEIIPRDFFISVVGPQLRKDYKESPDLVALRVEAEGTRDGKHQLVRFDLLDRYDAETGITAMMRTTGYSLAITGALQAAGQVKPGVWTPDEAMPGAEYIDELAKRNVIIHQSVITPEGATT